MYTKRAKRPAVRKVVQEAAVAVTRQLAWLALLLPVTAGAVTLPEERAEATKRGIVLITKTPGIRALTRSR